MFPFIYTCSERTDADLSGTPAKIKHNCGGGLFHLEFEEGSILEVHECDIQFLPVFAVPEGAELPVIAA